jgi:hypothetical protein
MSARDELIRRAQERATSLPTPEEWGYRVVLDEGDAFVGRWRGKTTDPDNADRRVFLCWDEDGGSCFHRLYASLGREIDRVRPGTGDTIVIARSANYKTQFDEGDEKSGQSYGVEKQPCSDPLPKGPPAAAEDEFPF